MEPAEVVLRFLASVGRADDAEFYLALFRAEAKERFALLHVDANVMRGAADAVALELGFLAALGLTPTGTLGLFAPAEAGEDARSLRRRLDAAKVPAAIVGSGADAAAAARRGEIPIVALAGPNGDDREVQLMGLVAELASRKLIFLARAGGFRVRGEVVPLVNLSTEAEALGRSRDLSRKEQEILGFARQVVFGVRHRLTVSMTSPLDLLRELFTVKGAGTMMRRGAVFLRQRPDEVDRDRLAALLASSFGRPPVETFFEQAIAEVYVEEAFRGAAVMVDTPLAPYLSKFAVEREAQGEGVGRDLWETLVDDHPRFFWRARPSNPIAAWYTKVCDGMTRLPEWHVFWRGLAAGEIPAAIELALQAPVDFT